MDFVGGGGRGLEPRDDGSTLVLYFIVNNFIQGASVSLVERKLAGLAFWFKMQGEVDVTKSFIVRQALKGYRKGYKVRDQRRPVSFGTLKKIVEVIPRVCFTQYEQRLFHAAFLLAFFGALRIGELVSPTKYSAGGLGEEDVSLQKDSVRIIIRKSKTDQKGRGAVLELFRGVEAGLCPVTAVTQLAAVRTAGEGPFLRHVDGSFLSRFQFIAVFQKCLKAAGLIPSQFGSHSFRIGAATEAARWGLGDAVIKRIGRWESDRFRLYVRPHLL